MRRLVAALAALAVPVLTAAAPAAADLNSIALTVTVSVNSQPLGVQNVEVDPDRPVALLITAANNGLSPQHVRTIRFSGGVLGLPFFGYETTMPFDIAPHELATRTLVLDIGELRGQATGLMPASVDLLDEGGNSLGSVDAVTDVRGSLLSLYGALGVVLLVFTAAAWASAFLALGRRDRQLSRWRSVGRFLPAGIGTGLLAVVWLSIFRLVAPEPLTALGVVLGGVLVSAIVAGIAARPEHDIEPLTAIIDPTVGVRTGVLEAPAPQDDEDEDAAHSGELDDADAVDDDRVADSGELDLTELDLDLDEDADEDADEDEEAEEREESGKRA
jgi:hypothetical protein